nr:type II toxin-antitoxin system RelE/ParE family toxin [uncultured Parasphingopyxis sp.]
MWLYTARRWGVDQAERYEGEMEEAFQKLSDVPGLGSRLEHGGHLYRRWRSGRHLIVYRADGEILRVVRVVHDQSDLEGSDIA